MGPESFDEMWGEGSDVRSPYAAFHGWFEGEDAKRLNAKQREAEELFRLTGITFNVYGRAEAEERLIPFDIIPRIISDREWSRVTRGIEQRVRAINAFLHDIYHRQEIIRAGRIPRELISRNEAFEPRMIGVSPPGGIYTHIVGIDLVRTGPDDFFVLEDNARTPSGVSYMLENRETMLQMFPELFSQNRVQAELFVRGSDQRWTLSEYKTLDDSIRLDSVDADISLSEIYDKLDLSDSVSARP